MSQSQEIPIIGTYYYQEDYTKPIVVKKTT